MNLVDVKYLSDYHDERHLCVFSVASDEFLTLYMIYISEPIAHQSTPKLRKWLFEHAERATKLLDYLPVRKL